MYGLAPLKRPPTATISSTEKSGSAGPTLPKRLAKEKPSASGADLRQKGEQERRDQRTKKVSITYEGDMELNLGQLVGEGRMIIASGVNIELRGEVLKVDIQY